MKTGQLHFNSGLNQWMYSLIKKKSFSFLLFGCGSILLFSANTERGGLKNIRDYASRTTGNVYSNYRQLEEVEDIKRRPVMHTFYEFAENETGMSKDGDQELLRLWEKYWNEAGWDTRILTMDDIPKTPRNQERIKIVQSMKKIGKYNNYCFLRWLAMASVGGWMCDYDVFPLHAEKQAQRGHDFLPNGGQFTAYDRIKGEPSSVPSLLSGSPEEWERLVEEAIVNIDIMTEKQNEFWNDQRALMKYGRETENGFILRGWVVPAQQMSKTFHLILESFSSPEESKKKPMNCVRTKGKMAMHFSHRGLHDIYQFHHKEITSSSEKDPSINFKNHVENRSKLIQSFLSIWRELCQSSGETVDSM